MHKAAKKMKSRLGIRRGFGEGDHHLDMLVAGGMGRKLGKSERDKLWSRAVGGFLAVMR